MTAYDDYCSARDHADDCFKIMIDLYRESIDLVKERVEHWRDQATAEGLVLRQRCDRAIASWEAATDAYEAAEKRMERAFDGYLAEIGATIDTLERLEAAL